MYTHLVRFDRECFGLEVALTTGVVDKLVDPAHGVAIISPIILLLLVFLGVGFILFF